MKILLAIDGSECSAAALEELVSRPWPEGSEVEVVSVAHPWPSFHDPFLLGMALHYQTLEDEKRRAEADVAAAAGRVERDAPALRVSTRTFEGPPKEVLLAESERFGADLVLVGSHGRGAGGRFLLNERASRAFELRDAQPLTTASGRSRASLRASPAPWTTSTTSATSL
jgi:nucleotide-binding universal stress UspA family protein